MNADAVAPRQGRSEPDLEAVALAKITRKTIERLAPFCQMRLPPNSPSVPLVSKTNSKILRFIQAVDMSMLVAQIGYRLASEAATLCDPFALANKSINDGSTTTTTAAAAVTAMTPEMLQTMAAHGHSHALRTSETFRDVQQEIYKIAAVTKDNDITVLVPPDPQQPAKLRKALKDVGTDLVANLNLLNQFSRGMLDLTSWWEWLEEELMSPTSTLLPSSLAHDQRDAELYARWSKIKGGYLDYYNTIRVVYTRYPQLLTTSSSAWQSMSSVPPPPSAPGSSWDGSFQDLGRGAGAGGSEEEFPGREAEGEAEEQKEKAKGQKEGKLRKVKHFKAAFVAGSIRFMKLLIGTKRVPKGKSGQVESGKKENQDPPIDVSPPTVQHQPPSEAPITTHADDDRRSASPSSSSSNQKSKVEKDRSALSRLLNRLRKGLARLDCRKSEAHEV